VCKKAALDRLRAARAPEGPLTHPGGDLVKGSAPQPNPTLDPSCYIRARGPLILTSLPGRLAERYGQTHEPAPGNRIRRALRWCALTRSLLRRGQKGYRPDPLACVLYAYKRANGPGNLNRARFSKGCIFRRTTPLLALRHLRQTWVRPFGSSRLPPLVPFGTGPASTQETVFGESAMISVNRIGQLAPARNSPILK
jgi:hypothetical protein